MSPYGLQKGKTLFLYGNRLWAIPIALTDWEFMLELVYADIDAPGLVNFNAAVAHRVCPSLPAAFKQPGALTGLQVI